MSGQKRYRLEGLTAAPFTPLDANGELNTELIQEYTEFLVKTNFKGLFVNGTLAEGSSLTLEERKKTVEAWKNAAKSRLDILAHIGTNCLRDSQTLARHAEQVGVAGIAAFSPSYHKPENEEDLVDYMIELAAVAPKTPFFYYDINFCTGVYLNCHKIIELSKANIPTFCGLKFSSRELPMAHSCALFGDGEFQVMAGTDIQYLSCLSLGIPDAVIASYLGNLFTDMKAAFDKGDMLAARKFQETAQAINNIRAKHGGGIPVAKAIFRILSGIDVGPVRLPYKSPSAEEYAQMRNDFEAAGLLDIAKPR